MVVEIAYDDTPPKSEREYPHPYQPYQIQIELMDAIYECIQQKQIGIFESPTGTGKSLSLICAALTWLRDHQLHGHVDDGFVADEGEPQWVIDAAREDRKQVFLDQQQRIATHLQGLRRKELRQKKQQGHGEPSFKRLKVDGAAKTSTETSEDQFLVKEYESDDENSVGGANSGPGKDDGLSTATRELLIRLGMMEDTSADNDVQLLDTTKIFYSSRTHSQLIQFAGELRRVSLKPLSSGSLEGSEEELKEEVKHLALGSRKNLCINRDVQRLGSTLAINEKCLQLQQSKSDSAHSCKFLPVPESEHLLHEFRDYALARVRDIEELAELGQKIGICPYYASRPAIKPSEIVTLPYPLLLQKVAREALDISFEDHVVVIDEAHNLMDAIAGIYSVTVSLAQLQRSRAQLGMYLQKFRNKLKGKNRVYLAQLIRVIDSLTSCLNEKLKSKGMSGNLTASELLAGKGADQVNLHKLARYVRESKIARKVDGYVVFSAEQQDTTKSLVDPRPTLSHVEAFFDALAAPSAEGRFFFEGGEGDEMQLKYLLLDSAFYFREIVEQARAVILLGGTMSPMDDYIHQLFPYLERSRIKTLTCGHVIPDENLVAWPVALGPKSCEFDFTFEKRSLATMIDALGTAVLSLIKIIPDGVVVFFPSYAYVEQVAKHWKSSESGTWEKIAACKPIFSENKSISNVDETLSAYSEEIFAGHGALLLSVVGGKMSEGINFSDRLGRGVIIVGLPFPNMYSVEWKAKMEYLKRQCVEHGGTDAEGTAAARAFYENACMRAVNQSIGRAIRHRGDYASIIMLDRRYTTARIQSKLPGWIKKGLVSNAESKTFGEVEKSIREFFDKPRGI